MTCPTLSAAKFGGPCKSKTSVLMLALLILNILIGLVRAQSKDSKATLPGHILGISFGNLYSSVAVSINDTVVTIPDSDGAATTENVVSLAQSGSAYVGQRYAGSAATVSGFHYFLGQDFDAIKKDLFSYPFTVVDDGNGLPAVQVKYESETKLHSPEWVVGTIFEVLRKNAQEFLGEEEKITGVYVAVPVWFNARQRAAVRKAAEMTSLKVYDVLSDSEAAVVPYIADQASFKDRKILTYDLGGTDFRVSVIDLPKGGILRTIGTGTGKDLGGMRFNEDTREYLIRRHLKEDDLKHGKTSSLWSEVWKAQYLLNAQQEVTYTVVNQRTGEKFPGLLTRDEFINVNKPQFLQTMKIVDDVLRDTGLTKHDITDVIVIGGSTYIPAIQRQLEDYFPHTTNIRKSIAPRIVVARGAAMLGGRLRSYQVENSMRDPLRIAGYTIAIETAGGLLKPIIRGGAVVPTLQSLVFTTVRNDQTSIAINLFTGERCHSKNSKFVESILVDNIAPARQGVAKVEVTANVEADGTVRLLVRDLSKIHSQTFVSTLNTFEHDQDLWMTSEIYDLEDSWVCYDTGNDVKEGKYSTDEHTNCIVEWGETLKIPTPVQTNEASKVVLEEGSVGSSEEQQAEANLGNEATRQNQEEEEKETFPGGQLEGEEIPREGHDEL